MKIGLGSAQFGMSYGVSNTMGMTGEGEIGRILDYATSQGIRMLDTASGYGESEKVLGRLLPAKTSFRIITKIRPVKSESVDDVAMASIDQGFSSSLKHLHQNSVYGLLLHQARDVLKEGGAKLFAWLLEQKLSGKTAKIGVSVYDRETLDAILENHVLDIVQLPLNILDQRLLGDGYLSKLKAANIEIHVRSVFLQGLLLMEPESLPSYFSGIRTHMCRLQEFMSDCGLQPIEAAIGFVSSIDEVDSVVCGVNTFSQLKEVVKFSETTVPVESFKRFSITDENILDPSQWRLA